MKPSVTIVIPHFESLPFLKTCIRQLKKHKHSEVEQKILIADQSGEGTKSLILDLFKDDPEITVLTMKPLWSGYGIDYAMRFGNINTDYVCQIHVDAFPIHKNWLFLCIKLIEEFGFYFVGQNHFISQPGTSAYPPNKPFFSMSPTFNVAKTATYMEMSLEAGFTRFHDRKNIDVPMTFKNSDWADWAKNDYKKRGSDDDTIAFNWEDNNRDHNKLGFGLCGIIGVAPEESGYGRIYEDVFFHFGFCRESIGVMPQMGAKYREWTRRINENYSDELIDEMLAAARKQPMYPENNRIFWDGKEKKHSATSHSINKRITELKNELD